MIDQPPTLTNTQQVIAYALVASFIAAIFIWMVIPPKGADPSVLTVVNMLLGALVAKFAAIVDFFFGSSQGSKDKDAAQNKLVADLTGKGRGNDSTSPVIAAAAKTAAEKAAPAAAMEAAPAAAEKAAPPAAADAAPSAAAEAAPPAAEAAAPAAAERAVHNALNKEKPP